MYLLIIFIFCLIYLLMLFTIYTGGLNGVQKVKDTHEVIIFQNFNLATVNSKIYSLLFDRYFF